MSKWISVEDGIPNKHTHVLVIHNGKVKIGVMENTAFSVEGVFVNISHWMPLPEPPKALKYKVGDIVSDGTKYLRIIGDGSDTGFDYEVSPCPDDTESYYVDEDELSWGHIHI
jgi:hypothetical protein